MSREAQASREKQARIILGEAEMEIANSFKEAAKSYQRQSDGPPPARHEHALRGPQGKGRADADPEQRRRVDGHGRADGCGRSAAADARGEHRGQGTVLLVPVLRAGRLLLLFELRTQAFFLRAQLRRELIAEVVGLEDWTDLDFCASHRKRRCASARRHGLIH